MFSGKNETNFSDSFYFVKKGFIKFVLNSKKHFVNLNDKDLRKFQSA